MPKFILYQAGLASITKDELKTIVICHVTADNSVFLWPTLALSTPFPQRKSRKNKKFKKPKNVTADVSYSMF